MTKSTHSTFYSLLNNQYRSITCLNGDLPSADFFPSNLPVIAVDGALNRLMERNITPDIVIGDLDSAKEEYLLTTKSLRIKDQNTSDFEKAIVYLEEQNLLPTLALGVNGGFLDHILHNINLIVQHNILFYAPPIVGIPTRQTRSFFLPFNTKISIFGDAVVSTEGLKWNLESKKLEFPSVSSCFNRVVEERVTVSLNEGFAFILIYLEAVNDAGCD